MARARPRVYLAGPITGLAYDGATDWREAVAAELARSSIDAYSPMRAKIYLKDEKAIDGAVGAYQRVNPLSAPKGICTRDREDCRRADVVLMNLLGAARVSIGSMIEIGWADAYRVPIVLVLEDVAVPNSHHHAMVDQLAGYVVGDVAAALAIVKALVLP